MNPPPPILHPWQCTSGRKKGAPGLPGTPATPAFLPLPVQPFRNTQPPHACSAGLPPADLSGAPVPGSTAVHHPPACIAKGREGPSPARGWPLTRHTASDNARLYVSSQGRAGLPGGAPPSSWLGVPHRLSKGPAIDLYECMEASWVASKGSAFLVQPAAPPRQDRNMSTNAPSAKVMDIPNNRY